MTTSTLLSVRDLHVRLATGHASHVHVVRGISFDVKAAQVLALVGESGAGKSVAAMSLIGLAPAGAKMTVSGVARFGSHNLVALTDEALRKIRGREIAVVFQDPAAALSPLMTVGRQVAEAVQLKGGRGSGATGLADLFNEVGLGSVPGIADRYPHELSGGQQQRVAIATALAGNPSLLIADEPTTALDMSVQAQILQLLKNLQQRRQMAMILITHDLGIVANHAHEVLVLSRGEMVEKGTVEQVLGSPREAYTRWLLKSRPSLRASFRTLSSTNAPQLLRVDDLVVRYPGRGILAPPSTAVDGVSLALRKGQALGIVGESGSGKSTLAKAIVGLVPIHDGTVEFSGERLAPPSRMTRSQRARLQYVFQDTHGALNPRLTVEQLVGEPLAIARVPANKRRERVVGLLAEVGLGADYLNRLPRQLSGGQRQRANIARALASSPDLLICDEVVSALDVSVQAQVLELLRQLQLTRGLSLLFISHDLAVVAELCDSALVMRDGRVVEAGDVSTVLGAPAHPYTRSLLEAVAALDSPLLANADLIQPAVPDLCAASSTPQIMHSKTDGT